jgi:hypothetical protein
MDERTANKLIDEINRYKNALIFFAKTCDWFDFHSNAATLFEYLESVELSLLKRKLHQAIEIIPAALVLAIVIFSSVNITASPLLMKYREQIVLIAAAAILFELFLLVELRLFVNIKTKNHQKRKDRFIRNIEHVFKDQFGADTCNSGT